MKKILQILIISAFIFIGFDAFSASNVYSQEGIKPVESNELKIYPNPTENGRVTLEMNTGQISEIRLINIAGKEAAYQKVDFETPKYTLELENVPNGIYFIRVKTSDNKMVVKKLVVSGR